MGDKQKLNKWVKANRRGSRDAELMNERGWKARNRVHRNKKKYNRKREKW